MIYTADFLQDFLGIDTSGVVCYRFMYKFMGQSKKLKHGTKPIRRPLDLEEYKILKKFNATRSFIPINLENFLEKHPQVKIKGRWSNGKKQSPVVVKGLLCRRHITKELSQDFEKIIKKYNPSLSRHSIHSLRAYWY